MAARSGPGFVGELVQFGQQARFGRFASHQTVGCSTGSPVNIEWIAWLAAAVSGAVLTGAAAGAWLLLHMVLRRY